MTEILNYLTKENLVKKASGILIALVVGLILTRLLKKYADRLLEKTHLDRMFYRFIIQALSVVVWIFVLFSIFEDLGMDLSSLLALLAAAGATIGLAAQGCLTNLASGVILMVTKPFGKGDYIHVNGMEGLVESISLLTTRIVTWNNEVITIPNSNLTSGVITNDTARDTRRICQQIGIAYEADVEKATLALLALVSSDSRILKDPAPVCVVEKYESSAVVLNLKIWCANRDYWDVKYDIQASVRDTLRAADVEIPFNRLDVSIRPSEPPK